MATRYSLVITKKNGEMSYDFTQPRTESLEEVQKQYNTMIDKARFGNPCFTSWRNVVSVAVAVDEVLED